MPKLYLKVALFLLRKLIHAQDFHYQLTRNINFNLCEEWAILLPCNQNSYIPKPQGIRNHLNKLRLELGTFNLLKVH